MNSQTDVPFILFLIAVVVAVLILTLSKRRAAKMVVASAWGTLWTSLIWVLFPLSDAKCAWPKSIEDAFKQAALCADELFHWTLVGAIWLTLVVGWGRLLWKGRASGVDKD